VTACLAALWVRGKCGRFGYCNPDCTIRPDPAASDPLAAITTLANCGPRLRASPESGRQPGAKFLREPLDVAPEMILGDHFATRCDPESSRPFRILHETLHRVSDRARTCRWNQQAFDVVFDDLRDRHRFHQHHRNPFEEAREYEGVIRGVEVHDVIVVAGPGQVNQVTESAQYNLSLEHSTQRPVSDQCQPDISPALPQQPNRFDENGVPLRCRQTPYRQQPERLAAGALRRVLPPKRVAIHPTATPRPCASL
jgi:hypothetical protein